MIYQEEILVNDDNVKNLYRFEVAQSGDTNYVAVVEKLSDKYTNEKHEDYNPNVKYHSVDQFQDMLNKSNTTVFDCVFNQEHHILKNTTSFNFDLVDKYLLNHYVRSLSHKLYCERFEIQKQIDYQKIEDEDFDTLSVIRKVYHSLYVVELATHFLNKNRKWRLPFAGNHIYTAIEMINASSDLVELTDYIKNTLNPERLKQINIFRGVTKISDREVANTLKSTKS